MSWIGWVVIGWLGVNALAALYATIFVLMEGRRRNEQH